MAQVKAESVVVDNAGKIKYADQDDLELRTLTYLLEAKAWHYRCFGLLRLERFVGDEVDQVILNALKDKEWQVRCFAIRAAARKGVSIPAGTFDQETEPRVIRMAQRIEVGLPENLVRKIAERELASRTPERVVMGIEIAVRSGDEKLIEKAKKRMGQLLQQMNNAVLVTVGDRLAELLGIGQAPTSVDAWKRYIEGAGKSLKFPDFDPMTQSIKDEALAPLAKMDRKAFVLAVDYFDQLHEQDLEIVVVIDGTGSMGSVVYRAQAEVNRLMLILNDLSNSMKMGVVVYRDKGDKPMLEATKLSGDTGKVRKFLFDVVAKGGGDFPEAIHEALYALPQFNWSSDTVKQAVIIADAPGHEEHMPKIQEIVQQMASDGLTTHTLMVGGNEQTKACLGKIAGWGSGSMHTLAESDDLGKMVIRFSIDEKLHESFDHLYDLYADLGL